MELTPQLLETQQFPEKFRGYDCDAVDDFLERVGVGVADLLQQLDAARARIAQLEQGGAAAPASPAPASIPAASEPQGGADLEQISRTLILAQKAADDALAQAQAQGREAVARAEAQAAEIVRNAEAQAQDLRIQARAEAEAATRDTQRQADEVLAHARSLRADAESQLERARVEAIDAARAEADRIVADARTEAAALVDEARQNAVRDLERRQLELESELEELSRTVAARRDDAQRITDLVGGRREAITSVARELEALGERLEDVTDRSAVDAIVPPSPTAEPPAAPETSRAEPVSAPPAAPESAPPAEPAKVVIDLVPSPAPESEPAAGGSQPPAEESSDWSPDSRSTTAHPAGSDGGGSMPRWATIDGPDQESPESRPGLHVADDLQGQATIGSVPQMPEPPAAPAAHAPPAEAPPAPPAAPAAPPAPTVSPEPELPVQQPLGQPAGQEPWSTPSGGAQQEPAGTAPAVARTESAIADDLDEIDDPFLAALRGREPLRGDEGDDDSLRRRRRRRR